MEKKLDMPQCGMYKKPEFKTLMHYDTSKVFHFPSEKAAHSSVSRLFILLSDAF